MIAVNVDLGEIVATIFILCLLVPIIWSNLNFTVYANDTEEEIAPDVEETVEEIENPDGSITTITTRVEKITYEG